MKTVFRKTIKKDKETDSLQLISKICHENKITFAGTNGKDTIVFDFSYNQLLSLRKFMNSIINEHYKEFESSMQKEKTQAIYIDDPVNW